VTERDVMDAVARAKREGLDLRITREAVPIDAIDTPWHGPVRVYPEFVTILRKEPPWPADLPLIVAACEGLDCAVIDGNHRYETAKAAGYKALPILAVPRKTVDALVAYFREDEDDLWENGFPFDEVLAVLAKASPLARENAQKEAAWERGHR